ncbi:MAG: phosphatase PAP2 family protein [Actinomycetota bacterium]|nr:phosphatase PAP2 family protein [Actinomycetota bacterium]
MHFLPAPKAAVLALALPLAAFGYLAADVVATGHVAWDDETADLARRGLSLAPLPGDGARLLEHSTLAGPLALAALALVLVLTTRARDAVFWTATVGSVFLLDPLLKVLFQRPGPGGSEADYSFPSGSALFGAVAVAAVAALMPSGRLRAAVALTGAIFCLAYGAAIVYVDWHHPSDVVAGWSFGIAWTAALWLALLRSLAGTVPRAGPNRAPPDQMTRRRQRPLRIHP